MKRIGIVLFTAMLACMAVGLTALQGGAAESPSVAPDKPEYTPSETAIITGSGFEPGTSYDIPVIRPDETIVRGDGSNGPPPWDTVIADDGGSFTYLYTLDGIEGGYTVEVYPSPWGGPGSPDVPLASTTFLDASIDLDQCANGPPGSELVPCEWQHGDLNTSNSHYAEGDSVAYRATVYKVPDGEAHFIRITYDFTKSGIFGFDYLTRFDRTEASPPLDPCTDLPSGAYCPTTSMTYNIPSDPFDPDGGGPLPAVSSIELPQAQRYFKILGGTITSVSAVSHSGSPTGDSSAQIDVHFTTPSSCSGGKCTVIILWGGHLASELDWGSGMGASSVPGAPIHMSYRLDGSGAKPERSIQSAAVRPPSETDLKSVSAYTDPSSVSPPPLGIDNDGDCVGDPPVVPPGGPCSISGGIDEDPVDGVDNDGDDSIDEDDADYPIGGAYTMDLVQVVHNNGPLDPVDVIVVGSATAPPGLRISYHCQGGELVEVDDIPTYPCEPEQTVWAEPGQTLKVTLIVTAPLSVEQVVVGQVDWECLTPCRHYIDIHTEVSPTDPDINDPDEGNNTSDVQTAVDCIAGADVQIVSQEFVDPPTQIDVSVDTPVTLRKVLHNNGGFPVTVSVDKTAIAPEDCTIAPDSYSEEVSLPPSVDVILDEDFTIHCSEPSTHTFTVDNDVSGPKEPHIVDPDMTNNSDSTDLTVAAIAYADLKVISVEVPESLEAVASENFDFPLSAVVHNNGDYGPVLAHDRLTFGFDSELCSVFVQFEGYDPIPIEPGEPIDAPSFEAEVSQDVTRTVHLVGHCSQPGVFLSSGSIELLIDSPHVVDDDPTNNAPPVEGPPVTVTAYADVKKVSFEVVDPPTDIDVSQDVPVTVRAVVHNNGPYEPVDIQDVITAVAPDGCTVTPDNVTRVINGVPESVDVILDGDFIIHCSEPSSHTFTFHDEVTVLTPQVEDPTPDNNTADTSLTVAAIAYADVKIVDQYFVSPPSEIDVSADVPVTLSKVLHNNGAFPVTVTVTKTATAPDGCSIDPSGYSEQVPLEPSVDVVLDEGFTIHCSQPSEHTFTVDNTVSGPKEAHIVDPDPTNNSASTDLTVAAIAYADVKIVSQQVLNPPSEMDVSVDTPVTLRKVLHNDGAFPVTVTITKTATAPADCTVTPPTHAEQVPLPPGVDVTVDEGFTIHCSKASSHTFTIANTVSGPKEPHIVDPNLTNNGPKTTSFTVKAIGRSDVKVVSVSVTGPAQIDVSQNQSVTVKTTLHNNGPYGPVQVGLIYAGNAPTDCSVSTVDPPQVSLPVSVDVVDNHTWTIHCSKPSSHTFSFTTTITGVKDPHVVETNPGNNSGSGTFTVKAIAYSDLKVAAQYMENPPAQIPVSQDVTVVLDKVIHNNGPWGPVDASTTTTVHVPADCTVRPPTHTQQFADVPVSVDVLHHEPFTIHCSKLGTYTFTFDDTVTVKEPHVVDPVGDNNSWLGTKLTVEAIGLADIKITSASFVNPPTKIPLGDNVDVTLRKHIHNNGPWTPVNIAITSSASAPTHCTIVPKSVPNSLSNVPMSVDQVVDEVWTVNCTQNTTLKTFVFNNSISVTSTHVYDPDGTNNALVKYLTVTDDPADPQGDMDGDGWTNGDEAIIGTDPADACPDDPSDDAWPPDVNNDAQVDIFDVLLYKPIMGGLYDSRYDLNTDDFSDIMDVLMFKPVLGSECTP